jgi:hypothetical protein
MLSRNGGKTMIFANSIIDFASRAEEAEKRNAEVPQWMLHDGSVDGFMIDTRFVPDRMDYETMAWAKKDVERDHYAEPVLEYHSGTLVEARQMHLRARKELVK